MSEDREAVVGVQSCGCVTYANSRPDWMNRDDEKTLARIVREGGQVIRTTVAEARKMPDFLPTECPHDPKGWEREPWVDPAELVKVERPRYGGAATVRRGYGRVGQVRRWPERTGDWYATEDWFNHRAEGANDGTEDRKESPVLGPFKTRAAAVDALVERVKASA